MITVLLVYFGVFFVCLLFMARFGKTFGLDFGDENDDEKKCRNTNATGYLLMSLFWFILIPIMIIIGLWELLVFLVKFIMPIENKEKAPSRQSEPEPRPTRTAASHMPTRSNSTSFQQALSQYLLEPVEGKHISKENEDIKLGR